MATERVVIMFEGPGAKEVADAIDNIGTKASKSATSVTNMLRDFNRFSQAFRNVDRFVNSIADLTDSFVILENRVKIATEGQENVSAVMQQLFQVAQHTRQPIDEIGESFFRLRVSLEGLGKGTNEAISITQTLFDVFTATSGSTSQARNAVTQLSVAFEQGNLTARQFRSLVGNQPVILRELASALGLTSTELRKLGADGKLSAEEVVDAFTKIAPSIEKSFKDIQPTIQDTLTQLKNTVIEIANLKIRSPEFFKPAPLDEQIAKLQKLGLTAEQAKSAIEAGNKNGLLANVPGIGQNASAPFKNQSINEFVRGELNDLNDSLRERSGLTEAAAESQAHLNAETQKATSQVNLQSILSQKQKDFLKNLDEELAFKSQIASNTEKNTDIEIAGLTTIEALRKQGIVSETKAAELEAQGLNLRVLGLKTISDIQENSIREQAESIAQQEKINALVKSLGLDQQQIREQEEVIRAARAQGLITLEKQNELLLKLKVTAEEADRSLTGGFARGFDQLQLEITDFASLSSQVITDTFHGLEDVLVQFVTTGKASFNDFVNSILADLTKLVFRQAVSGLFNVLLGGQGGFAGGAAGLIGGFGGPRAGGGPVTAGRSYVVGENGPELFTPNAGGVITPHGGIMAPAPNVNVSVVNVSDPDEVARVLSSPKGQDLIVNVVRKNKRAIDR